MLILSVSRRVSFFSGYTLGFCDVVFYQGGYMINWINGHTDMFKCLVNHDGIFNLRTLYYSTEVSIPPP